MRRCALSVDHPAAAVPPKVRLGDLWRSFSLARESSLDLGMVAGWRGPTAVGRSEMRVAASMRIGAVLAGDTIIVGVVPQLSRRHRDR